MQFGMNLILQGSRGLRYADRWHMQSMSRLCWGTEDRRSYLKLASINTLAPSAGSCHTSNHIRVCCESSRNLPISDMRREEPLGKLADLSGRPSVS